MYFYIYDSLLSNKKYNKLVGQIQARVSDLGISGKIRRLNILKSGSELVRDILKQKPSTIVAVGSDKLFCQAARAMAGSDAVLGFIPVGDSLMGEILGLPNNELAVDVISARLVEQVRFGRVNGQLFFSSLSFPGGKTVLTCEDKYQVIPRKIKTIKVVNLDLLAFNGTEPDPDFRRPAGNPGDKFLEVIMSTSVQSWWPFSRKQKQDSLFLVEKIKIEPRKDGLKIPITIDEERVIEAPAQVEMAEERLKIIVGKQRLI